MDEFSESKYLSKQDLIHQSTGSVEKLWNSILDYRIKNKTVFPVISKESAEFWFYQSKYITDKINIIEQNRPFFSFENIHKKTKDKLENDNTIFEAVFSSRIEGAVLPDNKINDILNKKNIITDKNEKMVSNNYEAIKFIKENFSRELSHELIWEVYNIVTKDTLDKDHFSINYRNEMTYVWDDKGNKIFTPVKTELLTKYMDIFINFYNSSDNFNPLLKSGVLHFYFMYIHPFFDGNGRTGRALIYMYLLKNGYSMFNFISVSQRIEKNKKEYYKQIKNSENEFNDITYFLKYYVEILEKEVLEKITEIKKEITFPIINKIIKENSLEISKRQKEALKKITTWKEYSITNKKYRELFGIAQETARKELNDLADKNLLEIKQSGKEFHYILILNKYL